MNITCIGVGNMGGAVARRLATSNDFAVTVFDPSTDAMDRCVAAGATSAPSLAAAVAEADVVLTSLPTPKLVIDTVHELLSLLPEDAVVVDISTIDPTTARTVQIACQENKTDFVACPLGKTPAHAERGEIPLFVGGDQDAVVALEPILSRMGEKTYNFGTVEAATAFKLVSNFIGMANVAILAEGLAIAMRAGIKPDQFAQAIADTGAKSFQSEVRLPWMIERDWAPRFGIDLAAKDVRLAVESALGWRIPVPVGSAALAQLMAASHEGMGNEDVVALFKLSHLESRH
jgi:3-hydroxyisobutyrate dehydrogenase